jgi:DNA-binding NarL/FixJ family response regulator
MDHAVGESDKSARLRSDDADVRLALVHDDGQDCLGLISILSAAGLTPDTAILPLSRVRELTKEPLQAIVVAVDLGRSGARTALRVLHRQAPRAPIVVVDHDGAGTSARHAMNSGAQAFVSQEDAARALAPAVHAVVAGLVCVPRSARRLVARPTFSHREKQILALLVTGMSNREIAAHLWLAESTVKTHITSAFSKLGVRSRQDAAAILLDPAEGLAAMALPPDIPMRNGNGHRSTRVRSSAKR